ncbi:hypothetical protein QBC34DRAFT_103193 [Podospora aff. communis PSN243]|uniref:Rhodopsin domain-containing protein n=1 Tax=Podospora aff. communis PSN243 TaxID=3040156 RepID=A0AAV9H1E5_9PEZI|nr:hypothetical protein QBC34DRAFT_103193 [Podospora aff. communis PSN243]
MNRGLEVAIAMWAMTALSLALVALRLYTRVRIVKFVGIEDHLFVWTGIFLLIFTVSIQVAVHYGLGRSFWTLSLDNSSNAILWTYIANTFAITGNAMAKLSMGFFLLRVVQLRGQKFALWLLIIVTSGTSIALVVMLWNQTTPVKASWDPLRTPGKWNIQIQPMSVGLGGWSSACDFFFAIFPWMFIWSLRMPRREKIMLASGMSLGVIAGACGVIRTVVLSRLQINDYTLNFATYFVWAGAEIAVSMVCLGVPTLRPLYLRQRGMTIGYSDRANTHATDPELPLFTMCEQKPGDSKPPTEKQEMKEKPQEKPQEVEQVQEKPCTSSSEPKSFLRDSSSSRTAVESSPSPEPCLPTKPERVQSRDRSDSVDDILGLYDSDRSRSRGRNVPVDTTISQPTEIWVRSEFRVDVERQDSAWPLRS